MIKFKEAYNGVELIRLKKGLNFVPGDDGPWYNKLIVPDRAVKTEGLIGHDFIVTGCMHDTRPTNPARGVAFLAGYHDPAQCRRCGKGDKK